MIASRRSDRIRVAGSGPTPGPLRGALGACLALCVAGCSSGGTTPGPKVHLDAGGGGAGGAAADASDPASLAAEAYVWGYPLLVSERTMQTLGALTGVNALLNSPALANDKTRFIVSPNQDTVYSIAVIDLRSEPMVLTVPDVTDRYWTYQFLDTWTDSFRYIGTRATGGKGGTFAITPPGFKGTLPAGAEQIASPTPQMFLLGRYLVKDDADAKNLTAIGRTMKALHEVTGAPAPALPPPLGAAPGKPTDVGSTGAQFFDELGDVLSVNPPAADADKAHLASYASLGIGPDLHPAAAARASDPALLAALEKGVKDGAAQIDALTASSTKSVNGWVARLDIGTYADDPLLRAAIAKVAWGANVPAEAVYPVSTVDASGQPYARAKRYVMHFDSGALPPVKAGGGFWSLTLYASDHFFAPNAIGRFAIGDRTPGLTFNTDGSLDLYIQADSPAGHEANWLPAPEPGYVPPGSDCAKQDCQAFTLILRLYLPEQSVLDGKYIYPGVKAQ